MHEVGIVNGILDTVIRAARGAGASRAVLVTHGGSWFIVSSVCVVPLPAATVCYTLALLSGPDGRAMCCLQHA